MTEDEEVDSEILYYRAVDFFVTEQGFYLALLELQGTDEAYCIATLKLHKAGYLAGQSARVIAALTMDSVAKYNVAGRDFAVSFLEALERKLCMKKEPARERHDRTAQKEG